MPSLPSGGRARARSRGSAPTAFAAVAAIFVVAALAMDARDCHAKDSPCVLFDCSGGGADTSGSPGRTGIALVMFAGLPAIAYSQSAGADLRVAHRAAVGTWITETVDDIGDVGAAPSMALDDQNRLVISYFDATNGDLKLATNVAGGWSIEVVDAAGRVGQFSSIASFPGGVGIAYYDSTLGALKYAERPSGGTGEWRIQVIDGGARVGLYPSLLARADERAISYYDLSSGALKLAVRFPGGWSTSFVDATGNVGGWTSLCQTQVGYGIAYYDFSLGQLKYAFGFGGPPWNIEVVDAVGDVGRYCSAYAFSPLPDDQIGISYYDATHGDLKYAQKRGGAWTAMDVDTAGVVGAPTALAGGQTPDDTLAIAYYDDTNADLLYASHLNPLTAAPVLRRVTASAQVSWERDGAGRGGVVRYANPIAGTVRLGLYDAEGRDVTTLFHEPRGPGDGALRWDGRDARGRRVASGVYFIRLDTSAGSATTPAVFVR